MSNNVVREASSTLLLATHSTRYLTKVLGMLPFTPYIDIWSPL